MMGFQKWPHISIEEASNGHEAVEKVKNNDYDVILMDVCMPDMDGAEACRVIRNWPEEKYRKVPIIAVTGFSGEEFHQASIFTDLLTKPFSALELKNKILEHTTATNQAQATTTAVKAEKLFKGKGPITFKSCYEQ